MIRFIAAIDDKKGIATDNGIPWDLPTDVQYYRDKIRHHPNLVGYGTYVEYAKAPADTPTFVATTKTEQLREGFTKVPDPRKFLHGAKEDIWVGGGAGVFASTIDLADELYLTRVGDDFNCTKFFPEFEQDFVLSDKSESKTENGITFHFEVWKHQTS